jgi:hypothetical protein
MRFPTGHPLRKGGKNEKYYVASTLSQSYQNVPQTIVILADFGYPEGRPETSLFPMG